MGHHEPKSLMCDSRSQLQQCMGGKQWHCLAVLAFRTAALPCSPARAPGAAPPMPSLDDGEFVRAPLPVTRERLYAPEFMVTGRGRGGPHEPQQPSEVEAFRDFRCAVLGHSLIRPSLYTQKACSH